MSDPIDQVGESEREFFDRKAERERERAPEELVMDEALLRQGDKVLRLMGLERDLSGKKLLECGCGPGKLTTYLALRGAEVHAFDISPKSVEQTVRRARANGVEDRVHTYTAAFEDMPFERESFDLAIGLFILHHLPNLESALLALKSVMKPGGIALFGETNALNPILMFGRRHLVGRFGIPKLGTDEEHPLTAAHYALIGELFEECEIVFPEFHFFEIVDSYLLRAKLPPLTTLLKWLDAMVTRHLPALRRYSYVSVVKLSKGARETNPAG